MKLLRDARTLKTKAIESLRTAMTAFNSYDEAGRVTVVLMHSQHACEMLLKAVLIQGKAGVFDKGTGRAIGFERCLGLCVAHHQLTPEEAGIMRAIDAQRDAAQHWFV
ncbi:HEPN domain-containing protein [Rhizobium sp. T1473]|uniref:HEPN domain-containing protein n=1 Tax=unclassified Rhizobium TaxID=2613769 RepID=UPI001AAE8BD4|nr:HEPN domain-containing protein [Rhizobium sp. T1473]MCA0806416.1 HEPN domain-containing protein [Rhizobium sp. T1473]